MGSVCSFWLLIYFVLFSIVLRYLEGQRMYTCSRGPLLRQLAIHKTNFYQCGESSIALSCGEYCLS